ncbi:CD2 antigen cytoplasmic tail-binding protein 2 homolog [Leptopilina boulardi]|uniref:CD2 antigen cytoplasmic tail-binding protein 2 homolog n=1 Tax=Leptopilina boulardi TaxID=63433 RepID=UPI0021F5BF2F|nr:CD2 antigen cytoplasmic tail-binding protein 2 homolog [Leptopilina boulardi]XP_051154162.1 CD2 antigen cytoplasmic tail-binding protein 2 homolog [Leptopilina boulardi]XP_051154163.1 CD2 antigen cytoplasmic tail-binding protein 2 homolog [Leptopilina boulardi]
MPKRKFDESNDVEPLTEVAGVSFKNSLDSDEDDDEVEDEAYNVMNDDDFEGLEEGPGAEANIGFTAFNMKEELEEGHFDKDGHYLLKKEKQIRDNWLDNIDWVKVKPELAKNRKSKEKMSKGIADSDSDSDEDPDRMFDPVPLYKKILEFLQPGETVKKALCRLGKGKKQLTTAERWKRKKDPSLAKEDEEKSAQITKLTEFANELLTRTGNMDIYEESYEQIKKKVTPPKSKAEAELDMYADDFDEKEKEKLDTNTPAEQENEEQNVDDVESVTWELKWSQNDNAEVSGPHKTEKMLSWSKEGYFKKGAWVRKTGQTGEFYSAARIDFDLYL